MGGTATDTWALMLQPAQPGPGGASRRILDKMWACLPGHWHQDRLQSWASEREKALRGSWRHLTSAISMWEGVSQPVKH